MQYAIAFTSLLALGSAVVVSSTLSTIIVPATTVISSVKTPMITRAPLAARNIRDDIYTPVEKEALNECEFIAPACMCAYSVQVERHNHVCLPKYKNSWVPPNHCWDVPDAYDYCLLGQDTTKPERTRPPPPPPTETEVKTVVQTVTVPAAIEVSSAKTPIESAPLVARDIRNSMYNETERDTLNKCEFKKPTCVCVYEVQKIRYEALRCNRRPLWRWYHRDCWSPPRFLDYCLPGDDLSKPERTRPASPPLPAPMATLAAISTSNSALEASPAATTTSTAINTTDSSAVEARGIPLGEDLSFFSYTEVQEIHECEHYKPTCWCIYSEARRIWIIENCGEHHNEHNEISNAYAACVISKKGPHLKSYCEPGKEQSPPANPLNATTATAPATSTSSITETVTQTSSK